MLIIMRLRDIPATVRAVPDLIDTANIARDDLTAARAAIRSGFIALVLLSCLTMVGVALILKNTDPDAR